MKQQMKKRANRQQGFTLLEMLVVLVIIGLLAGLVGPRLFTHVDAAKRKTAGIQVKSLKGSLETMRLDIGRFPTAEEGLAILTAPPADAKIKPFWKGPYLDEAVPLDPWNHPYRYEIGGRQSMPFALYSLGADGEPGGSDDNSDIGYLPRG
ncbi:MAG: type II secretion system major pseudopilin GspG [Gammaproteobacteria bacterium]|nr:type II secretion system major pseudopilin GspG [Gammaproteobacteria bacterium]